MTDTLEFVDYIFDRYTYLGLDETADSEAIRKAVARQRAANHTDKLTHVSEELRTVAERAREHIDECARVLLSDELRPVFDARLVEFKTKTPHLVSTSGVPLLDLTRFRVDVDYLLGDSQHDVVDKERFVQNMTGFDAKRLARAKARYAKDPQDWTLREDLRAELTQQFTYLSVLEDVYWLQAGVAGGAQTSRDEDLRAQDPHHFVQLLETKLERVREETVAHVEQRNGLALLGFAPPLLLTYAGAQADTAVAPDHALIVQRALASFEERSSKLRETVELKKQVAQELVALRRSAFVGSQDGDILDVVYIRHTDEDEDIDSWPPENYDILSMGFRLNGLDGNMGAMERVPTRDELGTWPNPLVLLEVNKEIPGPLMEVVAEANDWLERREAAKKEDRAA